MRLVIDEKFVKRNTSIGKYTLQAGLVLLVGALIIDIYGFTRPQDSLILVYALVAFFFGLVLTNVSAYYNNRWGRRPDKGLSDALKGIDNRYALYHYRLGAAHVLLGPNGSTVLIPKYQPGAITFEKGKWLAPGAKRGPLGLFSNDPIGNPVAEAAEEGYKAGPHSGGSPRAYQGYHFRILTSQGPFSPGGAMDYMVKGKLIGGFAIVAWPAEYGNSGVMTFIMSHEGKVYQRDLGENTAKIAASMIAYDPGPEWKKVEPVK